MQEKITPYPLIFLLFCLGLQFASPLLPAVWAAKVSAAEEAPLPASTPVSMNFNDVDINTFIKYISELTGKNFVVDQNVKGKITILSPAGVSAEEAYRIFESVLEVNGYAAVPSGPIVKIVPTVQARSMNMATYQGENNAPPDDRIVTRIVRLKYAGANEVRAMLTPLMAKTSIMVSHGDSGILTITDTQSNINRLLEIIRSVDVPARDEEIAIIPLTHASATSAAKVVYQLFAQGGSGQKGAAPTAIKVSPYERANALIVYAPPAILTRIKKTVAELDVEESVQAEKVQVVALQHARAEELVKVLMNLPKEQEKGKEESADKLQSKPVLSKDINIVADAETNSLIISGPREEYEAVMGLIKQLDVPRRMVYLEALIMEVQVNKDFSVGAQWGGAGTFDSETGALLSGFSGSSSDPYGVLQGLQESPAVLPAGFSFGVLKEGIKIGGITFPNLGAVLNAYKNDEDVNVIATPQILTTDNKKASIKVGENVPYITSKNTTDAEQDYTNYDYKDVATTLAITPQINRANVVRMDIGVEVIKLKDLNDGNPTTYTRSADTTVVVNNEQTVVIGGMIGQDSSTGEYKVPLLGDIPVLGWLFKTRSNEDKKTNLFIFITPHIVENPAQLTKVYEEKRAEVEEVHKVPGDVADRFLHKKSGANDAAVQADMGFLQMQQGKLASAKHSFDEALALDPSNTAALVNKGLLLEREGKKEEALTLYQKVLERPQTPQEPAEDPLRKMAEERLHRLEKTSGKKP